MAKTALAWNTDRHGAGCDCGVCDSNGKVYGAAVITYLDYKVKDMNEDELQDFLREQDPSEIVYAATMESALEEAYEIAGIPQPASA